MDGGRLDAHDRWVVLSCLGAALVAAVGVTLFYPLTFLTGGGRLPLSVYVVLGLGTLPAAAALVACVLTRVPLVAFSIGVAAGVVGTLVGVGTFVVQTDVEMGIGGVGGLVLTSALAAVPLVAADLLARLGPFTLLRGALAGLAVAVLRELLPMIMLGFGSIGRAGNVAYLVTTAEVVVPVAVLVLAGAVAGWCAGSSTARAAQPGWGPGTREG